MKTLKIDGVEYETETHDFNKTIDEIKIPKGWRLWTFEECIKLHNSKWKKKLNLDDCWFFVKQPFKINKKSASRFVANSYRADLVADGYRLDADSRLGVRFCREVLCKEEGGE